MCVCECDAASAGGIQRNETTLDDCFKDGCGPNVFSWDSGTMAGAGRQLRECVRGAKAVEKLILFQTSPRIRFGLCVAGQNGVELDPTGIMIL